MDRIGNHRRQPRHYVREWIESKNLNAKQIAERMERSEPTVSKLLSGRMKMTLDYLAEFAAALGLFDEDDAPEVWLLFRDPTRPSRDELLRGYSNEELTTALQLIQHSRNQASQPGTRALPSPDITDHPRVGRRASGGRGR